jgi:phosphatidylglycerol---prolipoprotein diacylglyceryl transferase
VQPILLDFHLPVIGEVAFPAYMTLLMIGFLVAVGLARRQGERQGLDGTAIVDLGLVMLVLGILGARLLAVLTDGKLMDFVHLCTDPTRVPAVDSRVPFCSAEIACDYHYVCDLARGVCHPPRDCLAALKFWQGGLTYYGGLLLAVPGGLWLARRKGLGAWRMADIAAPCIMLGLFFGRLGCFLNGCCYGTGTDAWVAVHFPGHAHPVHPTQLYEAGGALLLFAALHFVVRPRSRGHGEVFGWMLVLYGAMRMGIELYRADPRGALGPLSTSQILSIPLILAGIALIRRAAGRLDR